MIPTIIMTPASTKEAKMTYPMFSIKVPSSSPDAASFKSEVQLLTVMITLSIQALGITWTFEISIIVLRQIPTFDGSVTASRVT